MKLVGLAILLVAVGAEAKPKKGFWKVLVKPHQKWVLPEDGGMSAPDPRTITIETYDVRKVDGADVARLRYTYRNGAKDKGTQIGNSAAGLFDQVAVTKDGLYIMSADMDDAKVSSWLKRKPSRSDPPKAYASSKANEGRFLSIDERTGDVCMGIGPLPDAPDCADVCEGQICVSATLGVTKIDGTLAPDHGNFESYAPR